VSKKAYCGVYCMEEVIGSMANRAVFKPQYPSVDLGQFQLREPETECVALTKAVSGHHHHYTPLHIPIIGLTLLLTA